jgi:O-antigen/teichoic acid export membrane protein
MKKPNGWANSFWTLFANTGSSVAQWATMLFVARLLGFQAAGDYAIALAIVNPVVLFAALQMRTLQVADAAGRFRFGDVLHLRIWMLLFAALVVVQFGTMSKVSLSLLLGLLAWKAVEGVADIYHGAFQKSGRMDWVAQSIVTRSAMLLALVIGAGWSGQPLGYGFAAAGLGSWLIFLMFDRAQSRQLGLDQGASLLPSWPPPWGSFRSLLASGFPLGVAMMLISLCASVPRFALERFSGREALGLFATTAALAQTLALVINALSQASSAGLARYAHAGDFVAFRAEIGRLFFVGLAAMALGLSGLRLVASGVAPALTAAVPEGAMQLMVLQVTAAGLSGLAGVFGCGLTALGEFRQQLILFLPLTALCMILSWIWVPGNGPTGAAYVYIAVSAAQWIGAGLVLQAKLHRFESENRPEVELK